MWGYENNTSAQAAELLQLSEYTLREKLKRGEIKSFRTGHKPGGNPLLANWKQLRTKGVKI